VPIALAALLYAVGLHRVLERITASAQPHVRHATLFYLGLAVLVLALFSGIDALGNELFSAHMIQHELLMLVAAPLLVLGRPLPMFVWALPAVARHAIGAAVNLPAFARSWQTLQHPLAAWSLHAAALWVWHAPLLFVAALEDPALHDLQHFSFLATALLFWTSLLRSSTSPGTALLSLFTTTLHTSALGALLTFASRPFYSPYLSTTAIWNLTPLEDQQLGGLIMWVPGALVYVGFALGLMGRWLRGAQHPSRESGQGT
jgi:putative membrane protein